MRQMPWPLALCCNVRTPRRPPPFLRTDFASARTSPDVIMVISSLPTVALQQATRTIRGAVVCGGVDPPFDARDAGEIERAITALARGSNGGLIVAAIPAASLHRDLFIKLAARHRLPAVYPYRANVTSGGLISYGPDQFDI